MNGQAGARTTVVPMPAGATVKVVEREGTGSPVLFLHSGVGSAGEWRQVMERWPEGHRLLAVDAYAADTGPAPARRRTLDDFADQVRGVAHHVGRPVHLVGFSWGGATALQVAVTTPAVLASLTVVEPEVCGLLTAHDEPAFTTITTLRDRWREHLAAGREGEAYAEFVDFYNGPGTFEGWPPERRARFVEQQRTRGDLWAVLFHARLTVAALREVPLPVHVVEGSATTVVDHAMCEVVLRHLRRGSHTVVAGAGHMMPLSHPAALTPVLVATVAGAE
jgi:pimeloyl-ACP methyl ester carboxylesterase